MPRVCVVLSGCGVYDGSEIHEAVLTLLSLDQLGADYFCAAPNLEQAGVINHLSGKPDNETRNVLVESARIARGEIRDLAEVKSSEFDALILPGGFGAAKNLCTFATDGSKSKTATVLEVLLKEVHQQGKPIGAACIAPSILATVFGKELHPKITIGTDEGTAKTLEEMGALHQNCKVEECYVDEANLIVTTPAYMLAQRISEAQKGIHAMVEAVLNLMLSKTKT